MKRLLKKIQRIYVRNVTDTNIPNLSNENVVCMHLRFFGKVQDVGFRYATYLLAKELGLVGSVKNLEDLSVDIIVQGPQAKIEYLIDYMSNIKRAPISSIKQEELPLNNDLYDFIIL